jgi:hypothetical protein
MSLIASIAFGWFLIAAGTFLFLGVLAVRAFLNGGIRAYRKIDLGFPGLVLALLCMSICWPLALKILSDSFGENR